MVDKKAIEKGYPVNGNGAVKTKWLIDNYGLSINKALAGSDIFWAMAVAQFCEESFYGGDPKAQQHNNFAGMKNKPIRAIGTFSPNKWSIFATPEDCFFSYVANLKTDRYIKKGLLTAKTPFEQIKAVSYGGYFDDTKRGQENYIKVISKHIDRILLMYNIGKIQ